MATSPVKVGIAGASGYAGQELLRLLAGHPHARLTVATTGASDQPPALPRLVGVWDGSLIPLSVDALVEGADVIFLAVPEARAAELAGELLARHRRVIDLSGAFRLREAALRQRWYPATDAAVAKRAVYGLPERHRGSLAEAALIACPGCYPTAALLALAPLTAAKLVVGDIVIDAKSGISGAGKAPSERTHYSECHDNVAAYGVFAHRHGAEIEQELDRSVTFVPHLVPLNRGILETIYARVSPDVTGADVGRVLESAYGDAAFVRLRGAALPEIKHVVHTNFCDIGWVVDPASQRLVVVACLDNLVKGAAGQAVQNFNLALGFDERAGLR